jgi:hypothetical protein
MTTFKQFLAESREPPMGEPGSIERLKWIVWGHENQVATKERKLAELKKLDNPSTINWGKQWESDTDIRSISAAENEIEYFKERAAKAKENLEKKFRC